MIFDSDGRVLGTMDVPNAISRDKGIAATLEARRTPRGASAPPPKKRPPLPPLKPNPVKKPTGGPKPNPVRKPGTPKPKAAPTMLVEKFAEPTFMPHPAARRAHLRASLAAKL